MNNWEEEINKMVFAYVEDRDNLKTFIHSLLKQQREICAEAFIGGFGKSFSYKDVKMLILNAPEPELKEKINEI